MPEETKNLLIKWSAGVGSIVGAVTAILVFWGDWGWIVRKEYHEEHIGHPTQAQITALQDTISENHRHWICDELDEEIPELRVAITLTDEADVDQKERLTHDLSKKQLKFNKLKCEEFDQ